MQEPLGDPDRLFWDEFVAKYKEAKTRGEKSIWERADIASEVDTTYGGGELMDFSTQVTESLSTLIAYRWVARTYPPEDRVESLSFRHHQVIAARDDRLEWLKKAADNKWSVATLQAEVRPDRPTRQQMAIDELSTPKAPDEYTLRELMLLDDEDRHQILSQTNWAAQTESNDAFELYPDAIKLMEAVSVVNWEATHNPDELKAMTMLEFMNLIFQRVGKIEFLEEEGRFVYRDLEVEA